MSCFTASAAIPRTASSHRTRPEGLFGEFTTMTRVRGVIAASTCSGVTENPFSSFARLRGQPQKLLCPQTRKRTFPLPFALLCFQPTASLSVTALKEVLFFRSVFNFLYYSICFLKKQAFNGSSNKKITNLIFLQGTVNHTAIVNLCLEQVRDYHVFYNGKIKLVFAKCHHGKKIVVGNLHRQSQREE